MDVDSTYDNHDHSHHKTATDHHFLKFHKSDKTCIQCIAIDKYGPQQIVTQKIACRKGGLYM